MSAVRELTEAGNHAAVRAAWRKAVRESPIPVMVDFWAPWCGPCRAARPSVDAVAAEYAGRVAVLAVNVDEAPTDLGGLEVASIPCFVFYRPGGKLDAEIVGFAGRAAMRAQLEDLLSRSLPAEKKRKTEKK